MGSTWQRYGELNTELRGLRGRVVALQAVAEAAEAVIKAPASDRARDRLQRRLLDAGMTPDVVTAAKRQTVADGVTAALRGTIREREAAIPARVVPKPWGHEIWWAVTELYAGKILHVERGHRLSLQYHRQKDESCYLLSGLIEVTRGRSQHELERRTIKPGATWRNRPGEIHTIEALEDSDVIEVSTPQLDDVVRLVDDYGRIDAAP